LKGKRLKSVVLARNQPSRREVTWRGEPQNRREA
jgi:hypothetical protein